MFTNRYSRRFDFGQNQTALNLTKFVEVIIIFSTQHEFIMKLYSIIDLMKLIWYYKYSLSQTSYIIFFRVVL